MFLNNFWDDFVKSKIFVRVNFFGQKSQSQILTKKYDTFFQKNIFGKVV